MKPHLFPFSHWLLPNALTEQLYLIEHKTNDSRKTNRLQIVDLDDLTLAAQLKLIKS